MNTTFDPTNRGVLFKNDRKQEDKHPDYTGRININGEDHYLSAWIKDSKDGTKKFMSLSIGKAIEEKSEATAPVAAAPVEETINIEDVPF